MSPLPIVDSSLDSHGKFVQKYSRIISFFIDFAAVTKAKQDYFTEQMVRLEEIKIIRDKLEWCYRREGANHFQNCRVLANQYMELLETLKGGDVKPFKMEPLSKE